jgi:23S rRNA (uracil1939-C5)-methyltransferase
VIQLSGLNEVKNQPVTVIHGYSHAGEGVGRFDGKPVFIPLAIRGEKVSFAITEGKNSFFRGKLLEVLEPAKGRATAHCPLFQNCGGCQLQYLDYEEQLYFKQQRVTSALQRIGGLKDATVRPVLGMEHPWHYRHTARFHLDKTASKAKIGYYRLKSHTLEQIEDCALLPADFYPLLDALSDFLGNLKGQYEIPVHQLVLRKGWGTGELLVQLIADDFPKKVDQKAVDALASEFPYMKGIVISLLRSRAKEKIIYGSNYYTEVISGTSFHVPVGAFFQNNPAQTEVLLRVVTDFAAPKKDQILFDLYCGVGLFAHSFAPKVKKVYGIEENKKAVSAAVDNAAINGNRNTSFIQGRTDKTLPQLAREGIKPDTIILDPPRQGSDRQTLAEISKLSPGKIVYVSCDPATLARDIALLTECGYQVLGVQPVDMFPHTYHVECVVLMSRVEK